MTHLSLVGYAGLEHVDVDELGLDRILFVTPQRYLHLHHNTVTQQLLNIIFLEPTFCNSDLSNSLLQAPAPSWRLPLFPRLGGGGFQMI